MYFLWRKKPRSVLGQDGSWILASRIEKQIASVLQFNSAEEGKAYQKVHFPDADITVLNAKNFKKRTNIKQIPPVTPLRNCTEEVSNISQTVKPPCEEDRPMVYSDYLEHLHFEAPADERGVVFPPSNLSETTNTPLIVQAQKVLQEVLLEADTLEETEARLRKEIRAFDLLNSDRLHQIEMYELSDVECIRLVRAMRNAQIQRRKRKNELDAVLALKAVLINLDKHVVMSGLKTIDSLGKREYHCRILTAADAAVQQYVKTG